MNPDPAFEAGRMVGAMMPYAIFGLLFYVYLAVTLRIMARKLGLSGAWMAWLPIANMVLMCRIAGKSGALVIPMLIPLVNIVVGAYVWAQMAKAMGKSGVMGVLILVPIVNFFVPAIVAAGTPPGSASSAKATSSMQSAAGASARSSATGRSPEAGPSTARRSAAASGTPERCPHCGTPPESGDAFCGGCGKPLEPVASPARAEHAPTEQPPARKTSSVGAVLGIVAAVVVLGGGWFLYSNVLGYSSPERLPPALPDRVAGTMTEFPVDTDPTDPATPSSVITQRVEPGGDLNVPDNWMPPGVGTDLPPQASAITSTRYTTSSGAAPVNVHVVETEAGEQTEAAISRDVEQATGGERTGIQVESPSGGVYRGSRIQTLTEIIYVLANLLSDRVVIIYAPDPSAFQVATRLAGNVGNGGGLNDYPQVRHAFGALPAGPPPGLTLVDANTYNRTDFEQSLNELQASAASTGSAELQQLVGEVRRFFPQRITTARYLDGARDEWNVGVGEFGSGWGAWTTWLALRGILNFGGDAVQAMPSGDGVYADLDEGRMVFYRKGPYIVVLAGPTGAPLEQLTGLSGAFQL